MRRPEVFRFAPSGGKTMFWTDRVRQNQQETLYRLQEHNEEIHR